jgi:hypothetical protein
MKHPISGQIEELPRGEFLDLFLPQLRDSVSNLFSLSGAEAVVCFENLDMSSPSFGDRAALAMGHARTFQVPMLEEAGCRLGSVPSEFKYPRYLCWNEKG